MFVASSMNQFTFVIHFLGHRDRFTSSWKGTFVKKNTTQNLISDLGVGTMLNYRTISYLSRQRRDLLITYKCDIRNSLNSSRVIVPPPSSSYLENASSYTKLGMMSACRPHCSRMYPEEDGVWGEQSGGSKLEVLALQINTAETELNKSWAVYLLAQYIRPCPVRWNHRRHSYWTSGRFSQRFGGLNKIWSQEVEIETHGELGEELGWRQVLVETRGSRIIRRRGDSCFNLD